MTTEQIQNEEILALQPALVTYYLYDLVEGTVGLYTGKTVQLPPEDTQPANSSKWEPLPARPDVDVYFDGIGWFYGIPFANITPAMRVQAAKATRKRLFEADEVALSNPYSPSETKSWLKQEADAKAYKETGVASEFLTTYAETQNTPVGALVDKILAKAATYEEAYAVLLGKYKLDDAAITEDTAPPLTADDLRRA